MNRIDALVAENNKLKAENTRLRILLARHEIVVEQDENKNIAAQRLALYRSFFRGRQDVYAQRWYTKDGQKQYSPMVKWEYRHLNKKERQAATKRGEKIYEPLDDAALIRHLKRNEGRKNYAYGLYLIVNDNECYIAAMDFDGTSWKKDITAVIDTVEEHKFPYLVECSQSGEGAHLWFFFVDAIKAVKARQFCSSLLTLTMERYPMLAMQSYDRIFPSQDRITVQGFGSLIALPLEGEARQNHRTVFLDRNLNIQTDPWQVLRKLRKIEENTIDTFFTSIPKFRTTLSMFWCSS